MKLIDCPLTGPRPASEFVWGGEVRPLIDPATHSDADWADALFLEHNRAGVVREWWFHSPTGLWFIAERDTLQDKILRTYTAAALYPKRFDYTAGTEER